VKYLIVNADDFGFTRDVNAGIVHAHREGILTATTLMANGKAFDEAVRLAHETPTLDIGCHLALVQGYSLLTRRPLPAKPADLLIALAKREIDVEAELRSQIRKIFAAGLHPTHLDTHKHTHIVPSVFRTVVRLAHEFGIPYVRLPLDATLPFGEVPCRYLRRYYRRLIEGYNVRVTDRFVGFRLTGRLNEESLAHALRSLQPGSTEFMCHPGFLGAELSGAPTRLKESRLRELEALTSPRIRKLIDEQTISLTNYRYELTMAGSKPTY
jgi:predicted glycoside hydrolase/deacetylase ChbG (UPF0249 family)